MRVRDHIVVSTAGAALLRPWLTRIVWPVWAASILIDADHYAWFVVRHRSINPVAAVRYFDGSSPASHSATHVLHSPVVMLLMLGSAIRRPALLPVVIGMALHVALDRRHEVRMDRARAAVLRSSRFTCSRCGASGRSVAAHVRRQPMLFPSYDPSNLVALCERCHRRAHADRPLNERQAGPRA